MKSSLKSAAKAALMCWLVAAAVLSLAAPVRADKDPDKKDKDSALARVLQDTYWRWAYGVSNIVLPTDENTNAVLNGIALLPLPNAPGDGTPGSIDIRLRGGQSYFLPLFAFLGTSYTNGSPPDPLLDPSIFKTLSIKFTVDGKTVIDSKNVMDYYSQSTFLPPLPLNAGDIDAAIYFQGIAFIGEPLSSGKHVLKLDVKNTKPAFGFISEYHNTFNLTVSPAIVPPTEEYKGKTYAEWTAEWWQWFLEFPVDRPNDPHPGNDDPKFDVRDGQKGDVWFLAAPFGTVTRNITVPDNKALLVAIANAEVSSLEAPPFFGATEAEQRAQAKFLIDHTKDLSCTIDGTHVGPINSLRVSSPQFKFNAPTPWISGATGGKGKAVGDGYYVLLEPLPKGEHTIHFGGKIHFNAGEVPEFGPDAVDLIIDMTYNVKVK